VPALAPVFGKVWDVCSRGGHAGRAVTVKVKYAGVVQNGRFMGYTERGQSRANQGIPRFACNPDLNHALVGAAYGVKVGSRSTELS